jgi:hypothetical protein
MRKQLPLSVANDEIPAANWDALMIGMPAWVTTSRRRSPEPVTASARSASQLGTYTPLEDRGQLEMQCKGIPHA